MTLIWIDDYRDPFDKEKNWLSKTPFSSDNIIWVKSYDEFVSLVSTNGLSDAIAFDHDLGLDESGMDCAKWLVDYCLDNDKELPLFASQSDNIPGRENIIGLLTSFKKSRDEEG